MAADTAVRFSATIMDETGVGASVLTHAMIDATTTVAAMVTAQQAWVTAVDGVTGGKVKSSGLTFNPALPAGLKAAAIAGSRVEQTAVINMGTAITPYRYGVTVPGVRDTLIIGGRLNLAAPAVSALIGLLTSNFAGGAYTNLARQALTGLIDAVLSFREHRRLRTRTSFETA